MHHKFKNISIISLFFIMSCNQALHASYNEALQQAMIAYYNDLMREQRHREFEKITKHSLPYAQAKNGQKLLIEDLNTNVTKHILSFINPHIAPQCLQGNIRVYCRAKELSQEPVVGVRYNKKEAELILPLEKAFYNYIACPSTSKNKTINTKRNGALCNIKQIIGLEEANELSDLMLQNDIRAQKFYHQGEYTSETHKRVHVLKQELGKDLTDQIGIDNKTLPSDKDMKALRREFIYHTNNTRKTSKCVSYENLLQKNKKLPGNDNESV